MSSAVGKPTIYGVATRAGVSISTVSLSLNHPHRVSTETRRRVTEAAEAEGYRARSRGNSGRGGLRTIVVAAPFSSFPSYYSRLSGILERCVAAGVEVVVHDLPAVNTQAAPILDVLPVRDDLDGVIVMGTPLSEAVQDALLRSGIPVVLVDAYSGKLPTIVADDEHGGALIGEHLTERGHRNVLFAHEGQVSFDYVSAGMHRLSGLTGALESRGGSVIEHAIGDGSGLAVALRSAGATAVACSNDAVASIAHRVLGAAAIRVGEDVALTGYDGSELADALAITTVVQPFAESGQTAADLLLALLTGRAPTVLSVTLAGQLVIRASSAAIAAGEELPPG